MNSYLDEADDFQGSGVQVTQQIALVSAIMLDLMAYISEHIVRITEPFIGVETTAHHRAVFAGSYSTNDVKTRSGVPWYKDFSNSDTSTRRAGSNSSETTMANYALAVTSGRGQWAGQSLDFTKTTRHLY